jgi:hypothetical protein
MPACTPGPKKRSAKRVKNCKGKSVCVRYGSPTMTIKKHISARRRSFCLRHRCAKKTRPATPGYQSCKAWDCKTGPRCGRAATSRRAGRAEAAARSRAKRTKRSGARR